MKALATAAAVVILAVAGCSSTPAPSAPARTTAADTLVCRHYLAQRAWANHVTSPTLADVAKLAGFAAADDAQAQPGTKLRHDLDAMITALQHGKSAYTASRVVYRDCTTR